MSEVPVLAGLPRTSWGTSQPPWPERIEVVVVGGGQAGLSASYCLRGRDVPHVVLERATVAHTWATARWDSFCLVTPNWQCQLPGWPYTGDDPDGFMVRAEILAYLDGYVRTYDPPVVEGVTVTQVAPDPDGGFLVHSDRGTIRAAQVVMATGGYHTPIIPPYAGALPTDVVQVHSEQYRNPGGLPAGAVLVVGTGQSGAQIAEDLHLAGRQVHLAVGRAPRIARRYRGRDVVAWLHDMGYYDMPVDEHRDGAAARIGTNHYVTGRDGGHDIDLRAFALQGMSLYGVATGFRDGVLSFADDLAANLDGADRVSEAAKDTVDRHVAATGVDAPTEPRYVPVWAPGPDHPRTLDLAAAGITSVVWCIGFRPDFTWVKVPAFDGTGYPTHNRGVTSVPGLYVLGLPWLHTWGSGRFSGIARDAEHLAGHIGRRADAGAAARAGSGGPDRWLSLAPGPVATVG